MTSGKNSIPGPRTETWGKIDGQEIFLHHIQNTNGVKVSITNYGAIIQSVCTNDQHGTSADIVLGYDTPEEYIADPYYIGCIVGRFANRIAGGKVSINGITYQLSLKEGQNFHHHGGVSGFNKKVWESATFQHENASGVVLEYTSADGEEGFPGNLFTRVTYTLNDQNELSVDYFAETDQPTLINLTQHSYFNLAGHNSGDILGHYLELPLQHYLPVNNDYVPIGEVRPVENTIFDFKTAKKIKEGIDEEQLSPAKGYDNSWVIGIQPSVEPQIAATLFDPESKRLLKVYTTEPSIHVYTGNFLGESFRGKNNATYHTRSGICLEVQHFPDAPNHPEFPTTVLMPGKPFKSQTIFRFGVL
ncbi:MAG: aldose epimerase family protein [Mucilaginibacter sp.]